MGNAAARTVIADRGDAGARIDRVICRHLAGERVSRTRVQTWIAEGRVAVNGAPVARASLRAAAGDEITLPLPDAPPRRRMEAEPLAGLLDVLYEDAHLLALNKSAGVVVHPTFGHASGTMMNALLWYARRWTGGAKPALVGRLDKDTSGVLLVSKNAHAHAALQRATARGAAEKEYLAVVYGRVPPRGLIELPLAPDPHDRRRTLAGAAGGAPSATRFERLARRPAPTAGLALVRCTLQSGRRHQIRAHLAARGWPIVGDPVYGIPRWKEIGDAALADALRQFPRQALHAHRIAFTHPMTAREVTITAPPPGDFARLLGALGFELTPR